MPAELPTEIPIEALPVKVDSDLVKQALLNVVLNGVQSMTNGGMLTISAVRYDESAEISVRDQGGGSRDRPEHADGGRGVAEAVLNEDGAGRLQEAQREIGAGQPCYQPTQGRQGA